jgi:hypothetical protein
MKNIIIKKTLSLTFISLFFVQGLYLAAEPIITNAATTVTDDVIVTLNVDAGITISNGADATMLPNIGIGANKAVGSSSWSVATNNSAGYTLAVKASTSPALAKGAPSADNFVDYTPASALVPETWVTVAAGAKEFGFSARGTDVPASFGTATGCGNSGTGAPDPLSKYLGFATSDKQIATRASVTTFAGNTTTICFAAEQGTATYAASGAYTATITATAAVI